MSEEAFVLWLVVIGVVSIFLFSGDPSIQEALIEYLRSKS